MKHIKPELNGIVAKFSDKSLKKHFQHISVDFRYITHGPKKGTYGKTREVTNLYKLSNGGFITGLGSLLWLNENVESSPFKLPDLYEERKLGKILIPTLITKSPKFKVKGKIRFYFYETLKACKEKFIGNIKLPTGSGKTPIQLTLAYNQLLQLGTGIILVPTLPIKDQFFESAQNFGIKCYNYRDEIDEEGIYVLTHHSLILDLKNKERKKKAKQFLSKVKWIIGDEVHHVSSDSWYTILLSLTSCIRCHGFSALPVSESEASNFNHLPAKDAKAISVMGPVIYEKSASDLSDFLNIPKLVNIKYSWNGNSGQFSKWLEAREFMGINRERLTLIADCLNLLTSKDYNSCTFFFSKDAARATLELCNDKTACWFGGGVVYVKNNGTIIEHKNASDMIRTEIGLSIRSLILTSHAIEGLDLPNSPLNALVLHEGKSQREISQKTGRIVRIGEKDSLVINVWDVNCKFIDKHSRIRSFSIKEEFGSEAISCQNFDELSTFINEVEEND